MTRISLAAALSCLALVLPTAAQANILDPDTSTELAQTLADATEEQGVCYGWSVDVNDHSGVANSSESGSNFGPTTPVEGGGEPCAKQVTLRANVTYTSELEEAEDSASIDVFSSVDGVDEGDVEDLGFDAGDLLGDKDDEALYNMVAGLPLLVADAGGADPVPFEEATGDELAAAKRDHPTNSPGSDWWRMYWWLPVLVVPAVLIALLWLAARLRSSLRDRRDTKGAK